MRVQVPESTFGNLLGYRESLAGGDLGTIQTIRVMRKLVDQGYGRARAIIEERSDGLVRIAEALLEREVLDGAEVRMLIEGETLPAVQRTKPPTPDGGDKQQVLRPEGGKPPLPGLLGGERPQPA